MSQFQFAHPGAFALLALLPLMAILRGRGGPAAAIQYSGLALLGGLGSARRVQPSGWLSALRYLALAAFIVALARPQRSTPTRRCRKAAST